MPKTSEYNANDGTHPDWESLALRIEDLREKFTAAKGLVSLCKDEDELFDSRRKGFGPSYPTAIEPVDPLDISAAQTLIAISHHASNNALSFSGDGNYSVGSLENTVPFCRNYYQEDSSGNAHYAAREVTARRRDTTGWADPAHPMSIECQGYNNNGDTTDDDDSELDDCAILEDKVHIGGTSDEDSCKEFSDLGGVAKHQASATRPSLAQPQERGHKEDTEEPTEGAGEEINPRKRAT